MLNLPRIYEVHLVVSLEFQCEVRRCLVQVDPPADVQEYLVGGWRQADSPLLDRLFGMHAQGDDARPIVHMRNSSTFPHNCNRIRHHSGIYHHFPSEIRVVREKKGGTDII